MNHILHNKLEALKELCRRYKVKSLYAFGSVNTPRFTEKSDIDLLIEFEPDISFEEIKDEDLLISSA
jgi:predicted nucleotidyltransferase